MHRYEPLTDNLSDRLVPRLIQELQSISTEDSVLRALFEGTLFPAEQDNYDVPGYRDLSHAADAAHREMQRLIADQPDLVKASEAYYDSLTQMTAIDNFELFARGFGLAIRMMTEGIGRTEKS